MWMRRTFGLSLALLVIASDAMARDTRAEPQQQQPHAATAKRTEPPTPRAAQHRETERSERSKIDRAVALRRPAERHAQPQSGRSPDRYLGPISDNQMLKAVGRREVGSAAWYGAGHIGHRTANGEALDAVKPTAAHRSLPLNSLARVTNLNNGRSVIVRVTDRGPWSRNLLIDLSPGAADEIDMRRAGIVPVAVEPVATAARASAN